MTTFTLKDYVDNKLIEEPDGSVTINVEPIPFAGIVSLQDKEDREEMLRHQLHIVQAECHRLRSLLNENGIKY
jgi:hypothetical protein